MKPALKVFTESDTVSSWKQTLSRAITSPAQLIQILGLGEQLQHKILQQPDFRCLVTPSYLEKIQPGDPDDPLLRQVLPLREEEKTDGLTDPVGDLDAITIDGLLHKYHGRALLVTTGACAIHCRYCFRRHYPYTEASCKTSRLQSLLDYLHRHPDIEEIILSGGDPLMLDDNRLTHLLKQLEAVPALQTLRIHTRLPVVLPERITRPLLHLLKSSRFRIIMVIHANHASEIANNEIRVLKQLHQTGITLLNQSVLLSGVNDNSDTLIALSKRLHTAYTLPYYLHLLDPVQGAAHFNCNEKTAISLIRQMQAHLPGYLVPRLVREVSGKPSKIAISGI